MVTLKTNELLLIGANLTLNKRPVTSRIITQNKTYLINGINEHKKQVLPVESNQFRFRKFKKFKGKKFDKPKKPPPVPREQLKPSRIQFPAIFDNYFYSLRTNKKLCAARRCRIENPTLICIREATELQDFYWLLQKLNPISVGNHWQPPVQSIKKRPSVSVGVANNYESDIYENLFLKHVDILETSINNYHARCLSQNRSLRQSEKIDIYSKTLSCCDSLDLTSSDNETIYSDYYINNTEVQDVNDQIINNSVLSNSGSMCNNVPNKNIDKITKDLNNIKLEKSLAPVITFSDCSDKKQGSCIADRRGKDHTTAKRASLKVPRVAKAEAEVRPP